MSQAGTSSASGGSLAGAVLFLEGNTGGEIGPDGLGVVHVVGSGSISVSGNAGTNTVTISDTGPSWQSISASQTLDPNVGYFCVSPGGALSLLLPPTSSQGDVIEVALDGASSFSITQGSGQSIIYGNRTTTVGAGGSLSSLQQGDSVRLVCRIPNQRWVAVSSIGNLTVV